MHAVLPSYFYSLESTFGNDKLILGLIDFNFISLSDLFGKSIMDSETLSIPSS